MFKRECLFILDALSNNSYFWIVITSESVRHISQYLLRNSNLNDKNNGQCEALCACLRNIKKIISFP